MADGATVAGMDVLHAGLTVANLERSIAFYRDVLGMRLVAQQEGQRPYLAAITGFEGAFLRMAFLRPRAEAPFVIELLEYRSHPAEPGPRETNRPGNAHLCLRVDSVGEVYARCLANGVTVLSPPVAITSGVNAGAVAFYARDPDGITLEIFQPFINPARA